MTGIDLICPHDGGGLRVMGNGYHCDGCGREYPLDEGVVRFLDAEDAFYEGAYENSVKFLPRSERVWDAWPLWLINGGFLWEVRKRVPPGATVVELGCASGIAYFGRRYRMLGCDLSLTSLRRIEAYELRLQADAAMCLPLPDASVDAVVSSYFWEHIPSALKPSILAECRRILKPGGKLIFLYDVETRNPLIACFRNSEPALYHRLFLEGDGHVGYEDSLGIEEHFRRSGFRLVRRFGMEKTFLQSPSVYWKLSSFRKGGFFRFLAGLGHGRAFYLWTALLRLSDGLFASLLPRRWARIEMTTAEKPHAHSSDR